MFDPGVCVVALFVFVSRILVLHSVFEYTYECCCSKQFDWSIAVRMLQFGLQGVQVVLYLIRLSSSCGGWGCITVVSALSSCKFCIENFMS